MNSSPNASRKKLIVDSVHGDVHLTPIEQRVVDTSTFQRLRHLKQLGFAQFTYPNATHTRFAHSIGVLGIMEHVTRVAQESLSLSDDDVEDIRLAGLLHDVGHYPYSHLMERIDKVQLTEEFVDEGNILNASFVKYPNHERVGELIVTRQQDLVDAIGSSERAQRIADLFTRKTTANPQLSKLIHSSLDMDRLDYLLRDSRAAGVPFGEIDLNYLVNNFRISPEGMLGVSEKALSAVEHFLLARYFMYQNVYFHKTTFGFEEACRQMLRRVRDANKFKIASDGDGIANIVSGDQLGGFADSYVDRIIEQAAQDDDPLLATLANSVRRRRPPKLLKEVRVLEEKGKSAHSGTVFELKCKHRLKELANNNSVPLGRFLVCRTPPLTLEERGPRLTEVEARSLEPEEREELIKVFVGEQDEPVSVVGIPHSILNICSNHFFQSFRLYFVRDEKDDEGLVPRLQQAVAEW